MSELNLEEIESRANATPTKEQLAEMFRNFSEYPNQDAEMYSAMLRSRTASAEQVKALIAEVRRLRADLDAVRALAGPDNESGFISTDALLHTIGTGESMLTELQTQIERLRGLHKKTYSNRTVWGWTCSTCCDPYEDKPVKWPCPTIQTLGGDGE